MATTTAPIVTCIESHKNPAGPLVIQQGARLRADAPEVKAAPKFFVADGVSDREIAEAREFLRQRPEPPAPRPKPRKPKAEVVARESFRTFTSPGLAIGGRIGYMVEAGSKWPADHEVVKANRKKFKKA